MDAEVTTEKYLPRIDFLRLSGLATLALGGLVLTVTGCKAEGTPSYENDDPYKQRIPNIADINGTKTLMPIDTSSVPKEYKNKVDSTGIQVIEEIKGLHPELQVRDTIQNIFDMEISSESEIDTELLNKDFIFALNLLSKALQSEEQTHLQIPPENLLKEFLGHRKLHVIIPQVSNTCIVTANNILQRDYQVEKSKGNCSTNAFSFTPMILNPRYPGKDSLLISTPYVQNNGNTGEVSIYPAGLEFTLTTNQLLRGGFIHEAIHQIFRGMGYLNEEITRYLLGNQYEEETLVQSIEALFYMERFGLIPKNLKNFTTEDKTSLIGQLFTLPRSDLPLKLVHKIMALKFQNGYIKL